MLTIINFMKKVCLQWRKVLAKAAIKPTCAVWYSLGHTQLAFDQAVPLL